MKSLTYTTNGINIDALYYTKLFSFQIGDV